MRSSISWLRNSWLRHLLIFNRSNCRHASRYSREKGQYSSVRTRRAPAASSGSRTSGSALECAEPARVDHPVVVGHGALLLNEASCLLGNDLGFAADRDFRKLPDVGEDDETLELPWTNSANRNTDSIAPTEPRHVGKK